MNLVKLLLVLRARYRVALLVAVLAAMGGIAANEFLPRRYTAETVVMVDMRSPDPVANILLPAMMAPGSMGTQIDIINSDRVGRKVVRMLRLDHDPAVREMWQSATQGRGKLEEWMSGLLRKGVRLTPSRDSNVLTISYQGSDPVFVAAVANAFAQAYIEASVELKVEPARQYNEWFSDQAKVLRENVEKAQARLSDFQREKGIVATEDNVDSEHTKLRELTTRLTAVQGDIRETQSKQRTSATSAETLPELMQGGVIQALRSSINSLEVKLKETASNLGPSHPQYQRMETELAELKNRLAVETKQAVGGFSSSTAAARLKEAELKDAIATQTRKVLNMKRERDEIAVLQRDVETAKRAYEAVTNRVTQSNLESQATRTNVSVLTPAVAPLDPTFPMPMWRAILLSIIGGIILAGVVAIGLEFLDQRVRTAEDLGEMLQVPVLAVIGQCRPPRRTRLGFRRAPALPAP